MIKDAPPERALRLGKAGRTKDGALRQCYAAKPVCDARYIEHLYDEVDSLVGRAQQVRLAVAQLERTCGNRARGGLVP
jgi:hypothetical protein